MQGTYVFPPSNGVVGHRFEYPEPTPVANCACIDCRRQLQQWSGYFVAPPLPPARPATRPAFMIRQPPPPLPMPIILAPTVVSTHFVTPAKTPPKPKAKYGPKRLLNPPPQPVPLPVYPPVIVPPSQLSPELRKKILRSLRRALSAVIMRILERLSIFNSPTTDETQPSLTLLPHVRLPPGVPPDCRNDVPVTYQGAARVPVVVPKNAKEWLAVCAEGVESLLSPPSMCTSLPTSGSSVAVSLGTCKTDCHPLPSVSDDSRKTRYISSAVTEMATTVCAAPACIQPSSPQTP